nr:unnamed protein product [Ananas comosus var. bracteatus]
MDISTSPVLESTNFFCKISSPTISSPFSSFHKNNPLRKSPNDSIFLLKNRSWTPLAASRRGIGPVSARFRRPLRRRNTLREKIVPSNEDQVRRAPELFNPDFKLAEKVGPTLGLGTEKDIVENDRLGNGNSYKDSVLWDKLENWINQYKDDSEYWGIGTGPIFTVYKDSDANVTRVVVNEEEIVKRSRIGAWSFESKRAGEEFAGVNSKLSCAKVIAKDIESGKYMLPKSSSIFKYVVEGKNSSFAEGLVFIAKKGESILKITPQVGFALLCGCCVFWVMKKLIVGNDKVELSREEVEMLRRKKMSRMKREELEKGSVKVLQDVPELAVASLRRPELDRSELIKSIKQTEVLRENLIPSHSNASFQNDDKIKEIREMVKKVHELERENQNQNDNQVEALKEASDDVSMSRTILHKGRIEKDMKSSVDMNNKGMLEEESLNNRSIIPEGELSNTFCDKRVIIDTKVDDRKTDEEIDTKEKANSGFDVEHSTDYKDAGTSSFIVQTNEEKIRKNEMRSSKSKNRKSKSSSGTSSKKSVKIKPRIISSVKEAREYLATKRRTKLNKSQVSDELVQSADMIGSTTDVLGAKKTTLGSDSFDDKAAFLPKKPSCDYTAETKLREGSCFNDLSTANDSSQVERKKYDFLNDTSDRKSTNSFLTEENSTSSSWDPQSMSNSSPTKTMNGKHRSSIHNVTTNESSSISSSQDLDDLIVERQSDQEKQEKSLQNPVDYRELEINGNKFARKDWAACIENEVGPSFEFDKTNDFSLSSVDSSRVCNMEKKENNSHPDEVDVSGETGKSDSVSTVINGSQDKHELNGPNVKTGKSLMSEESWIEKNFQEFNPIIQKMRVGFKENYVLAKDKAQEELSLSAVVNEMGSALESEELEWMNDESLREIVFQVRENELAGRDPFHMMDATDKRAFFEGLERKVEMVNERLLPLHEYYHSRIENLDYGADGISLDDPPEKIIPYWKGPSFDKDPEFLSKKLKQKETESSLSKVEGLAKSSIPSPNASVDNSLKKSVGESSKKTKTLIECSDGSTRPGKKGGKEHWEHTKKWSQGFLEVYNAETDPEVKSIMRNMGKDLDRWITEKEIQDATDLLTKIPKRKRRYIEKKMNKLKREVEKYGAQAVVSKYKEYSDEKEEDYLSWLDLPFVLCIELYTVEEDVPRVGFYSLEMAADLELDPKQYHVIAFEDPGDSKNFCYIVQAHMDMLGSGKAFVVARPPKDAFRDAKAGGFSVTVIRKGEITLNVDQTLEEVEEEITEIGSKIYHDKIMHERSVDARTLLKGVITADRSAKG